MVATTVTTKEQLYWTPQSSVLLAIIVRVGLLLLPLMVFLAP